MYIGIDIGTTHSSLGICDEAGASAAAVPLDLERLEPFHTVLRSQVFLPRDGVPQVGFAAERAWREQLAGKGVEGTLIHSFKPLLSKQRLARDVRVRTLVREDYSLHSDSREPVYQTTTRRIYGAWTRREVVRATTALLEELQLRARRHADVRLEDATRIVMGVPLIAGAAHQRRLLAALANTRFGRAQGVSRLLERVRFVPEPVAAAWFAGMQPHSVAFADEVVAVCDSGGGTTDLALIRYVPGESGAALVPRLEVGLGGVAFAGDQLSRRLLELVLKKNGAQQEWDGLDGGERLHARVLVEDAKRDLSERAQVDVRLAAGRRGYGVQRTEFERAIGPELHAFRAAAIEMLDRAKIASRDVHRLFLVGGSTLVPAVQRTLLDCFPLIGPAQERRFDAADAQQKEAAITSISAGLAAYGAVQDQQRLAPANYFFLGAGSDKPQAQTSIRLGTQLAQDGPTQGDWVDVPLHRNRDGKRCLSVGLYHDLLRPTFLLGAAEWPVPKGFSGGDNARARAVLQPGHSVPEIEVASTNDRVAHRFSLPDLIRQDGGFLDHDREMWEAPERSKVSRRPLTKLIEPDDVLMDLASRRSLYQVEEIRPLGQKPAAMTSFASADYSLALRRTKNGVIDPTMKLSKHQPAFGEWVHPGDDE